MRKFGKYAAYLLLAVVPAVTSCSDDDGPKKPSREIVQVDIYKADADMFQLCAQYKMTYDGKNRVSGVRSEYKSQEVSFTYGVNSFAYRWEGNDPAEGVFVNRFEAELRGGRVQVGSVDCNVGTESDTYNYNYHYTPRGYILDATFGGSQSFNYEWAITRTTSLIMFASEIMLSALCSSTNAFSSSSVLMAILSVSLDNFLTKPLS